MGWTMTAWPSDFVSTAQGAARSWRPPSDGLLTVDRALHEWIGRLAYAIGGKT